MTTDEISIDDRLSQRTLRSRVLRYLFGGLVCLVVVLSVCYWLITQSPAFYETSIHIPDQEAYAAGESLEVAALYLRNDIVEEDSWVAEFSEEQINGWLASDLPRKFSTILPENIGSPRVAIEPGKIQIGLTTSIRNVETVLVATIDFFPTETDNFFGVRILGVHAGWVPLPVSFFTKPATQLLQQRDIKVQWYDDSEGYPVALLTVPKNQLTYEGKQLVLEQFEIADGSIRMAGKSLAVENAAVLTPVAARDADKISEDWLIPVGD